MVYGGAEVELAERLVESDVVVRGEAVGVQRAAPDEAHEPPGGLHPVDGASLPGPELIDYRLRARLLDRVQHRVRDVAERLVPGDALPLALAALRPGGAPQGVLQPLGAVHHAAEAGALLTAARVHVRDAVLDHRVDGGLLLPPDDAVLRVHAERAAARGAGAG